MSSFCCGSFLSTPAWMRPYTSGTPKKRVGATSLSCSASLSMFSRNQTSAPKYRLVSSTAPRSNACASGREEKKRSLPTGGSVFIRAAAVENQLAKLNNTALGLPDGSQGGVNRKEAVA